MLEALTAALPAQAAPVAVFLLVLIGAGGALYALFQPQLTGESAMRKRLAMEVALGQQTSSARSSAPISETRRKQSIEKALSEMAERERAKQRAKMTIRMRMGQAGLPWSTAGFYVRALIAAVGGIVLVKFGVGTKILYAAPLGSLGGLIGVHFYVASKGRARMRAFLEEFPNAIDIVTRGVKTGLPLGDCLKAIAAEGQEPVSTEFERIVQDLSVGLSLAQALSRFTQRVPIMEANLFAVVVTIQGQLGGNLSEALGNLSRVLRERKLMKQKIKAFSSEATSSGAIIAAMPVAVGGILYFTSPDYVGLLFSEFAGNLVLAGCAFWMLTGVLVMRNMIRFDF